MVATKKKRLQPEFTGAPLSLNVYMLGFVAVKAEEKKSDTVQEYSLCESGPIS